jgi:hypothetical protein
MPVVLKRWSVPTGEPDNTERVPSGSVEGWGKRSVSYLARSLPNLLRRMVGAMLLLRCTVNARILLVILFPSYIATMTTLDSGDF